MKRPTDNLDPIAERIRAGFSTLDAAREEVLPLCREAIRHCSQAIRALHRQEFPKAESSLKTARGLLGDIDKAVRNHGELRATGYVRDAQKEYAEGRITLALVRGEQPPTPEELGVSAVAYLHGLGEAVGELRRYLLDGMRRGDLSQGEELLSAMDDIYNILVTIDFPDAITNGLRRTTDMVRGILERTRSDLTLIIRQKDMEEKLDSFQQGLD